MTPDIRVIGGGLAGCEAAWAAANRGAKVRLYEMRPRRRTQAHQTDRLAELVCSNSLKSMDETSASAVLRDEMRDLGSLVLPAAWKARVPAGNNLSVDRDEFAKIVTGEIESHPNIEVVREEVETLPEEGPWVLATGPLTSSALADSLKTLLGDEDHLYFYDAIAPIVTVESLDRNIIFAKSRYDKGDPDYLNCPMNKEQYDAFMDALDTGDKHEPKEFEKNCYFEGCQPVERIRARGHDTLRFGPMKPVGLEDPRTGQRPWACVQLRQENAAGSLYNLVGFQTQLKWGEQDRIFRMIPGLEKAEFARFGSLHRNTFINAPEHLAPGWKLRGRAGCFLAGQLSGVEGYVESAASGILAGINVHRSLNGHEAVCPPRNTVLGSLAHYLEATEAKRFQPINAMWGLVQPLEKRKGEGKKDRHARYAQRARELFQVWKTTFISPTMAVS